MSNGYRILLVDDEPDILDFISYNLKKEGYEVSLANNGAEALITAKKILPHLVLMDVMMPGMDGIETCELMRKEPELEKAVIAFLTARSEDYSTIAGFEAGADDYIYKPIKPKVLQSRIKALLKRYNGGTPINTEPAENSRHQDLFIDRERYLIINKGEKIHLPKKEFELLELLISKPDKLFTREEIFHKIWGDDIIVGDRTIDVHIRKLREKIGDHYIHTVKGVGYKFVY